MVVECDEVEVGEEDAAGALGGAEAVFLVGAVDINVAVVGIDLAAEVDAGFEAAEAEDAGGDEVGFVVGVFGVVSAGGDAAFEDHAGRLAGSDAFGDLVPAARGAEGVAEIGGGAAGSGDDVGLVELAGLVELEGLGVDANKEEAVCGLDAETGGCLFHQFPRGFHRE